MRKRILCTLLALCLLVGMCPIFASAGGRSAYLVDMDGTVHHLAFRGDTGDGKTWSFDSGTETLTLNGYQGRCVFGILSKIVLADGSQNNLAGMYIENLGTDTSIEGSGSLTLKYDESLLDINQFKWGKIYPETFFYKDVMQAHVFPGVFAFAVQKTKGHPEHSNLYLNSNLALTGGIKEGENNTLALDANENYLIKMGGNTLQYYMVIAKTENGTPASYVHIAPAGSTPPTPSKPTVGGFGDVHEGDYYADAVVWAVKNGITNGIGDGKFGPGNSCTRGQIVTFLWNAAGKPEPKSASNSFADVKPDDYFYKAVLWAVENDITSGTGENSFSPSDSCTRNQAVTFLWRAEGKPSVAAGNAFSDVESGSYYENAVNWAVANKITSGTSANKFSPGQVCTRGQIVTFLYRTK